jgi:hypothetical protein
MKIKYGYAIAKSIFPYIYRVEYKIQTCQHMKYPFGLSSQSYSQYIKEERKPFELIDINTKQQIINMNNINIDIHFIMTDDTRDDDRYVKTISANKAVYYAAWTTPEFQKLIICPKYFSL